MAESKQYNQYFSTRPIISITMPSSKRIKFVGGMYVTDKEDEIEFLNAEIKFGNAMLFVKKDQLTVDSEALDPLAAVKKRAIEEYLENQKRAMDPNRDMGNTSSDISSSIQTSKGIAAVTVAGKSK